MKRILLTGFEPFSTFVVNPSQMLVEQLSCAMPDMCVEIKILPVDYEKASMALHEIEFSNYDFVFQFGVASGRQRVSLERVALNWMESSIPDNSGRYFRGQAIAENQPQALFSSLDLASIRSKINQTWGECTDVSFSAGAYLCNFVYFQSRLVAENCLFIHIPQSLRMDDRDVPSSERAYQHRIEEIAKDIIRTTVITSH